MPWSSCGRKRRTPDLRPWFGPLGALAWTASLDLYEAATLGRTPWWWRLRRSLRKHSRGLDSDRLARRVQGDVPESLAYGETPAVSVLRILQVSALPPGATFLDLGAGRGLAACVAACAGYPASGLEYFEEHVRVARRVAADLELACRFEQGDFLSAPLPRADLTYACSTAFGEKTRLALGPRLAETLAPGALLATLDWIPDPDAFEALQSFYIPGTWGVACAVMSRRR